MLSALVWQNPTYIVGIICSSPARAEAAAGSWTAIAGLPGNRQRACASFNQGLSKPLNSGQSWVARLIFAS